MTKDIYFSPYKNSLFNAICYALANGLAFGIGNRHSKVR